MAKSASSGNGSLNLYKRRSELLWLKLDPFLYLQKRHASRSLNDNILLTNLVMNPPEPEFACLYQNFIGNGLPPP